MLTHKFGDFVFVHMKDQPHQGEPLDCTISILGFEFKKASDVIDLLNQINRAYLFMKGNNKEEEV